MNDVPADGEVETAVGGRELVDALMLEREPGREASIARPGELQMRVDDVDAEDAGAGKKLGQPRGRLAGAAAGIENARRRRAAA